MLRDGPRGVYTSLESINNMSEFNIFEELVKLQTSSANIARQLHDIDYDDFFNADNRHPEAGETSVQELINSYE